MGKTKKGKTKKGKTKGGIIWGPPDADTDYRELAVLVSSAKKSSDVKKLYHEFKENWDNIVKENKERAFYGRLSGHKAQLWKDIIVKTKDKSRENSRENRMQSLYTKQRTKMKGLVKSKSKSKSKKIKGGMLSQNEQDNLLVGDIVNVNWGTWRGRPKPPQPYRITDREGPDIYIEAVRTDRTRQGRPQHFRTDDDRLSLTTLGGIKKSKSKKKVKSKSKSKSSTKKSK
tara:strand:+ start:880 stop:1566 length:687 start_codon:yes stop_codon:yes gene_type:complete